MDKNFVDIIKKVVNELKKKGDDAISSINTWKSLLNDFAHGEYKQEIEWVLFAIGKNVHMEIYKADDLKICKLKQIRIIQEQLRWTETDAIDMVDTLACVLRGESSKTNKNIDPAYENHNTITQEVKNLPEKRWCKYIRQSIPLEICKRCKLNR